MLPLNTEFEFNGEIFEYSSEYFPNGLLNPKVRIYESDNYTAHYDEQTGQVVIITPEHDKIRVRESDEPTEPGEPVPLVEGRR